MMQYYSRFFLVLLVLSIVIIPISSADEPYSDAEMISFQAFWLAQNGSVSKAMKLQEEAVAAEPGSPLIWYQRGRLFEDYQEDDATAVESYQKSYELDPSNDVTKMYLKNALFRLGRYDEADAIDHIYETTTNSGILPSGFNAEELHHVSIAGGKVNVYYPDTVPAVYEQEDDTWNWSYAYAIENILPERIYLTRMTEYIEDNEGSAWTDWGDQGLYQVLIVIEPGEAYSDTYWVSDGVDGSMFCGGSSEHVFEGHLVDDTEVSIPLSVGLSCT